MEIGRGAQYKVIDTLDGRVLKIPLSQEESAAVVARWYDPEPVPSGLVHEDYLATARCAAEYIQGLLAEHPSLNASFGNPSFLADGSYTQDKAQTLKNALQDATPDAANRIFHSYADLIVCHWKYGFAEKIFNCTFNNGTTANGNVILLDFGELTTDRQEVCLAITTRRWLSAESYRMGVPEPLRPRYAESMAERLTIGALTSAWKSAA